MQKILSADECVLNAWQMRTGGVIYALCDHAIGELAAASYRTGGGYVNASIQAPELGKKGQSLFAKTQEIKVAKSKTVYGVTVTDEDDTEIAQATFTTFYIGERTESLS